ncbi:SURF1 family cytochrome oxidase biogenesis protein [uncultured Amnibacterium sp.]|uniref:SURF1 family cytochrome oxidase biogenesis protein n=1 Tax=uncultured Amnibacterium sp. TaxID=1631851 RepID=UPI0035C9CADB
MTSPAAPSKPLRAAFVEPRALGLLALFVLLAGVFAGLCQWQISRAVEQATVVARPTERTLPLTRVARPAEQQTDASVGQRVRTTGRFVPADTLIAGDRLNDTTRGWWVIGHAVVDDPAGAQLAVAVGFAPTRAEAEAAAAAFRAAPATDRVLEGRYVDSDAAEPTTSGDPDVLTAVSTARLLNLWTEGTGGPTYEGVLTLASAPDGLTDIWSPRPGGEVELNLLNLLYAVEWAIFAVAAFYVWYRLIRDRWEQQQVGEDEEAVDAFSDSR